LWHILKILACATNAPRRFCLFLKILKSGIKEETLQIVGFAGFTALFGLF
jgi:hypothetical protein